MALPTCPVCGFDDLDLIANLEDGRKHLKCLRCGHDWKRGEAKRVFKSVHLSVAEVRKRFPSPLEVDPSGRQRAAELKKQYLRLHPEPGQRELEFRERYRQIFSREGLERAEPQVLKDFANANVGGNPGNMSVFNTAWNELGAEGAARRVKDAIAYLLYGPEGTYLEDRLTDLIEGRRGLGMQGFREALLTKVLCMREPRRFMPINKYTGHAGKKEIARWVYDLHLPAPQQTSWTIGRLIILSNDLLMELAGEGFQDSEHVAAFLWWAKDQAQGSQGGNHASTEEPEVVKFQDDDEGFRRWMKEHPAGLYLNCARNPAAEEAILHQVGCMHVGDAPAGEGMTWTRDYIKVCSTDRLELEAWIRLTAGAEARPCLTCQP